MERGERRRMAAGSKGIKKKGLKMTANVKSILLFPLLYRNFLPH